jgi:glycosyltransferase involved in cell wall biosynthesis
MSTVVISVIMPVYNAEKYLREAIDSILTQTFGNFEFIIIDDSSSDESIQIIESYNDSRIIFLENEVNQGISVSLNRGIKIARGKYIARMDSDDIAMPQRLEVQYSFLQKNSDICILGSWVEAFDEYQNKSIWKYPLTSSQILIEMLFRSPVAHPSVMFRKSIVQDFEIFYNPIYSKSEDYDLWTRLVKMHKFANLDESLLKYRIHSQQTGSISYRLQRKQSMRIAFNYLQSFGIQISYHELKNFVLLLKYKKTDALYVRTLFNKYKDKILHHVEDMNEIDTILGAYYRSILDFDTIIQEYINILESIQDKREIILYGYGMLGKSLYIYMNKHGWKVKYVIDRNNCVDLDMNFYKRSIHDLFQEGNYIVINTVRDITEFISLKCTLNKKFSTSIVIP